MFSFDVFAIQPYLITKSIAFRLCVSIVGSLLKLLGMMKVLTENQYKFLNLTW